ncbi:MAG: hypothetical protein WBP81_04975 [Solirubrobacteraceae bacterium]
MQLAVTAPDDAGDAGEDVVVVVADEDPEFLLIVPAGSRDRGGGDVLLEQRQVGRIRRVLDEEAGRAVHRLSASECRA